jgi:hypothetical protein
MAEIYNQSAPITQRARWPLILLALAIVAALIVLLALWIG